MELKKYTQSELNEVIRLHQLWLKNDSKGKLADFSYSDLSNLYLSYSNLYSINLSHVNFSYANLSYSDLSYSDLSYADLSHANLSYANLLHTDLLHANLDGIITDDIIEVYYEYFYDVEIKTKKWITVGCQEYSLEQWLNFNELEIFEMGGVQAVYFYPRLVTLLKQTFNME